MFFVLALSIFILFQSSFSCPTGTIEGINSNYCYKLVSTVNSWLSAEFSCLNQSGHLATVDSIFLNDLLRSSAELVFSSPGSYWLGKTTLYVPGQWTWSDGSNVAFTNWAAGQPGNSNGSNCLSGHIPGGKWYSESCTSLKPYICEIPQNLITNATSIPPASCPDNGIYDYTTRKCYIVFNATMAFDQVNDYCAQVYGGSFGSVHSAYEDTIIGNYAYQVVKLGQYPLIFGLYSNDSVTWAWIDGSVLNYTNWGNGYPDGDGGTFAGLIYINGNYSWASVMNLIHKNDSIYDYFLCQTYSGFKFQPEEKFKFANNQVKTNLKHKKFGQRPETMPVGNRKYPPKNKHN